MLDLCFCVFVAIGGQVGVGVRGEVSFSCFRVLGYVI